ncbi:hypothetical protein DBIPINDM_003195 [Mesorhizobium sp. AR02]|nr:hypothetical protein DBIPINDM_003195 [Mesorhizobium sp. AR02]
MRASLNWRIVGAAAHGLIPRNTAIDLACAEMVPKTKKPAGGNQRANGAHAAQWEAKMTSTEGIFDEYLTIFAGATLSA